MKIASVINPPNNAHLWTKTVFFFPMAVFIRKFDCIYIYVYMKKEML